MNIKSGKIWRSLFVALLILLMIYFGFKRERFLLVFDSSSFFKFLNKYPRVAVTDFKKEMSGLVGFSLSPKLLSSVLYSFVFLILTTLIVHVLYRNRRYSLLTVYIFLAYMVVCFALIQLGNFGVDYRLSIGLSHYLEDLFLSPFPLMILIPAYLIADKMQSGKISN